MPAVVFDLVGTCFGYEAGYEALDERIGDKLREVGVNPKFFMYAWMNGAEKDYSYLSLSKQYKTFQDIIRPTFYRTLHMAGIGDPKAFATDEDVNHVYKAWFELRARPGLDVMVKKLREANFRVCAATDASLDRVKGYFDKAGVEISRDDILSCDSVGAGKPEPIVYQKAREIYGKDDKEIWFAAAHSWDCSAAKASGYRSAFCTIYEKYNCAEIFGVPDVQADTLPELADKIIAASKSS